MLHSDEVIFFNGVNMKLAFALFELSGASAISVWCELTNLKTITVI